MSHPSDRVLRELIQIYSPTGQETEAVEKFGIEMLQLGANDFYVDTAGNGIATFRGGKPDVLLCGHIDTVPGRLPIREDNGIISGRGATDAKASLVSLMFGARLAVDRGFAGKIRVIAAVGEEGPGKGIIEVASSQPKSDFAVFGEPSGLTGITVGYRGRILLDLEFSTEQYHASAPWMGENAIDLAIRSWDALRRSYGSNRDFSSVSAAITSISGGEADNMTPSNARITIDIRYPPSKRHEDVLSGVLEVSSEGLPVLPVSRVRSYVFPYVAGTKTSLARAFKSSIAKATGRDASLLFKSGSGDMNILGSSWRIPCITYGPGNPQLSHTVNEEVRLEDVWTSAEIVADALLQLQLENKPSKMEAE